MTSQDWATQSLRQMVIQQIEDTYKNYGNPSTKTSQEVEKQILDKAQSRDNYLQMVARLILHIKEVRGNQYNRQEGNSLGNVGNVGNINNMQNNLSIISNQMQNSSGLRNMPNNIRAQFTMGSGNLSSVMKPNQPLQVNRSIPQTVDINNIQQIVNISRPNQSIPAHSQGMITPNMIPGATVSAAMTTSSYMSVPQQQSFQSQVQQLQPMQQVQQIQQQQVNLLPQKANEQNIIRKQMQHYKKQQMLTQQRNQQQQQQQIQQQMLLQQQLHQPQQTLQQQPQQSQAAMSVQNQNQEFTMPSVKASNIPQPPTQQPNQQKPQISQSSPAKNIPAPSPQSQQPVPSPIMQPSPAYINPPSVGPSPSPLTQAEEQTYLEKLKEMSKYVEPLTRLITQMPKDEEHKRDRDKMNGLLDTLTNKHRRVKLIVLHKCENVLNRLFPDVGSSAGTTTPDATIVDLLPTPIPKTGGGMPQMGEAVKNVMSSAHLMSETRQNILPGMLALNAPMICPPTPAMTVCRKICRKRPPPSSGEEGAAKKSNVPRPLQMEVVRLLKKYTFSLDPAHPADKAGVTLLCKSTEQDVLPGSLSVRIPTTYPHSEPTYNIYSSGLDLQKSDVENLMDKKLLRLPHTVTFTSILTAWEQSVRESLVM